MFIKVFTRALLGLLLNFTVTHPVHSEGSFTFSHPIRNIAIGRKHVIVATGNLYLLNHTLDILQVQCLETDNITHRKCEQDLPQTFNNKILLVYNDLVLSCWDDNSAACREYSVNDLTPFINYSKVVTSNNPYKAVTGFIVQEKDKVCLVTATSFTTKFLTMWLRDKYEFIFPGISATASLNNNAPAMNFVDAFSWRDLFMFPYYPSQGSRVSLVVLDKEKDTCDHFRFVAHYDLECGTEPQRLVSSFAFESSWEYMWAGVFTTNGSASPDRTAICIYNLTMLKNKSITCLSQHFAATNDTSCKVHDRLMPINSKPTITHGNLTAVYAMEVQKRLVLFLGTGNGQLLKVSLNSNYGTSCANVLHEFKEEEAIFRTMLLDPVDNNYIYVATAFQIKRLKIANCEQYESCNECLSAEDPHCGWCQSEKRCSTKGECKSTALLENWIGISEDNAKCLGIYIVSANSKQIEINVRKNPSLFENNNSWSCTLYKNNTKDVLCSNKTDPSLSCSCQLPADKSSGNDEFIVESTSNGISVLTSFQFDSCSQYSQFSCLDCISSGCLWCTKESECRPPLTPCESYADRVIIQSVQPNIITFTGKSNVMITGKNLQNLTRLFLVGTSSCKPQVVLINKKQLRNSTHVFISLPQGQKEVKQLCVHFDGRCHQGVEIFYEPLPSCSVNLPTTAWLSGGRNLSISGKRLKLQDNNYLLSGNKGFECIGNNSHCYFLTPPLSQPNENVKVNIHNEGNFISCGTLQYKKDPDFKTFSILYDNDDEIALKIEVLGDLCQCLLGLTADNPSTSELYFLKTRDELNIQVEEIKIHLHNPQWNLTCGIWNITSNAEYNTILCKAKKTFKGKTGTKSMEVKVTLGNFIQTLETEKEDHFLFLYIFLVIPLLAAVVIAACVITRYKSKKLSKKLNKQLELLECDIRQEIRDGFAEFQMDKELVTEETLCPIPFLDYKHFALKTFFPESNGDKQDLSERLCENVPSPFQKSGRKATDDNDSDLTNLQELFNNQGFLVLLIHTLEKQKDFSIKDRCLFASFLTIIFQSNLLYFTGLLETLIKDLIEQHSSKNPKLMLRRTETVVEKLLTNWMATCLYGFLRESVGEPLYSLVHTLDQRIHKGPIDAITSKALYTLNEDWLLWKVTDFNNIEINVELPTSEYTNTPDACQCIKVSVLDCDTIGQVKEKILQTFLLKNGYSCGLPISDICLELHYGQTYKELSDVDTTNTIMENGLIRLNTVKHYKIENGATIRMTIKKDYDPVKEYSKDYFHLEMPDCDENEDLQNMENKGKQKFKVKELYLTKLLSTKCSILYLYFKLFRSIWTISHKPPVAVKYFFDFLDAQGEIKKVSDPDVLHIWKTNSLPLRFWVNILKNPQFVFDIKKTALLDSCLSVIAQAFMDGFSLTDHQLGKSAPTNKLLYAKDIPQFKKEIKSYYKDIREAPTLSSIEMSEFLTSESKKHEHEFKEDVAIWELYKYIEKYHDVIISTLENEPIFESELKRLLDLKKISKEKTMCAWE
ncbi:plexin-C1 [Gastrophryne carolinensis]